MSVEETREDLKRRFNLNDQQLDEILKTGVEAELVQVAPTQKADLPPLEGLPEGITAEGVDILKALKGEADLDQIMRFMIIDNWVKERFGKKLDDATMQRMLEAIKGTDTDKMMDRMMKYSILESFMEGRKTRGQPPQPTVDVEKAIRDIGDKMAEALKLHKLEEEKTKAEEHAELYRKEAKEAEAKLAEHIKTEEEEKKLEAKVKAEITPIQEQIDKRISDITKVLKEVPPEERNKHILDLSEAISEAVTEEVKDRIVSSIRETFAEKEPPPISTTPEGKIQVDWYKLGERALKTLDKFIEKLPTQAPPKMPVKEMPPPPPTETPPTTETPPPPPTLPQPETIIPETTKEQTEEAEKTENEQTNATQSSEKPRKTHKSKKT